MTFVKGHQQTKMTPEHRHKIGLAQRGVKERPEVVESIRRRMLGIRLSDETKEKMSKAHIGKRPYIMTDQIRRNISVAKNKGRTPLRRLIRNSANYTNWRDTIFNRDNFVCVICGKRGGPLQADHHPIPFAVLLTVLKITTSQQARDHIRLWGAEGRTLCVPCHRKTETYSRKLSGQLLKSKIEEYTRLLEVDKKNPH